MNLLLMLLIITSCTQTSISLIFPNQILQVTELFPSHQCQNNRMEIESIMEKVYAFDVYSDFEDLMQQDSVKVTPSERF